MVVSSLCPSSRAGTLVISLVLTTDRNILLSRPRQQAGYDDCHINTTTMRIQPTAVTMTPWKRQRAGSKPGQFNEPQKRKPKLQGIRREY